MPISGVKLVQQKDSKVFLIEKFEKDFQDEIRNQLSGIWHGFSHAENNPTISTYKITLKLFLERFSTKTSKTKKGMIGELLSHILINHYMKGFDSLSVLQNKEENSIKKGFDMIYFEKPLNRIWYSEIKSGKCISARYNSNQYNLVLLKRSNQGLKKLLKTKRNTPWTSALIDVDLMVKNNKKKIAIRDILNKDVPVLKNKSSKNGFLISVLYNKLSDQVDINEVNDFNLTVKKEKYFSEVVSISIQKATYGKIEKFLISESKK